MSAAEPDMCDVAHLLYVIEICLVRLDFVSPLVHFSGNGSRGVTSEGAATVIER